MKVDAIAVVGVYETNRTYGGPEEGGWYFECGQLCTEIAPITCENREEVPAALEKLRTESDRMELNVGRREPGSVLCNGWFRPVLFSGAVLPSRFPAERPRYE